VVSQPGPLLYYTQSSFSSSGPDRLSLVVGLTATPRATAPPG
jgi:hypothetical protein